MHRRGLKKVAIVAAAVLGVLVCAIAVALAALQARTDSLHDDYSAVLNDARYRTQAQVEGVEPMTQDVSCGYAVIEIFRRGTAGASPRRTCTTNTEAWSPRLGPPSATR